MTKLDDFCSVVGALKANSEDAGWALDGVLYESLKLDYQEVFAKETLKSLKKLPTLDRERLLSHLIRKRSDAGWEALARRSRMHLVVST